MVIAIILIVGMLGTAAAIIVPRILASRADAAQWGVLVAAPGAMVRSTDTTEVHRVDLALSKAVESLRDFGPWGASAMMPALAKLRIIVNPVNAWQDSTGQWVGGQAYYTTVTVGRDLTSLCHEMAHALEIALDGASDDTHRTWVARGITAADEDYRRKLATSSP